MMSARRFISSLSNATVELDRCAAANSDAS